MKTKEFELEAWDQSEIFCQTQNMRICFVKLMVPVYWILNALWSLPFLFIYSAQKHSQINNFVLFVMCGLWAVMWIFCSKHCVGGSIKSFWVDWCSPSFGGTSIIKMIQQSSWKFISNLWKHVLMKRKIFLSLILLRK